jgi:hypothetical protein
MVGIFGLRMALYQADAKALQAVRDKTGGI